jgi:23S rRNA (adenine2503-C2)-methyltransferase
MIELYGLHRAALTQVVRERGGSERDARRLWRYLYREAVESWEAMPDLPQRLRERLATETGWTPVRPVAEAQSADGLTDKALLAFADGQQVETVRMRQRGRTTYCLSSQAGCALGCVFCATGQQGFRRDLTAAEIVAQAMFAQRRSPRRDSSERRNIVMMGMGEPLLNYDAVLAALDILCDPGGCAIGFKQVTISTVGVVPGIVRLADEARPFSLAVSLHAATQEERRAIVPTAGAWPLDALLEACQYYVRLRGRKIFFEWTLIRDTNDTPEHARRVGRLLAGLPAHVNLIPLNPTEGFAGAATSLDAARLFQQTLSEYGLPSTVRQRRGVEIAAGCGQLAGPAALDV